MAGSAVGLAYLVLDGKKSRQPTVGSVVPEQTRRIEANGGEIAVTDGGQGELPVLLLHGLGGSTEQWRPLLALLRGQRRAIALDFRGHGASGATFEGGFRIAELAADVTAVADALGLDRFVLAGHSLGATVAIAVAAASPKRVAGLFLLDPNGDQTKIPRKELTGLRRALKEDSHGELGWHFRQILVGADSATRARVLGDLGRARAEALRGALESSLGTSPVKLLEAFGGPCLSVVSPLNDLPYSLHVLLPELPRSSMRGSHWLMLDRPEEVCGILEDFVKACCEAPPEGRSA